MNDLISRQALCEYALNQKDKSVTPNDIMRFPSAQPELAQDLHSTCADAISRQAAIERLKKHREVFCKNHIEFTILSDKDKARVDEIDNAIATLVNLPSAQPYTAEEIQKMQELESAQVEKAYELGREYAQPEEAIPISWIEAMIKKFIMAGDAFSGLTASIIRVMLNE